jgi:hypothetical protein
MTNQTENTEVNWKALDTQVYGTITAPADKQAHSAIVFVAGSGPQTETGVRPSYQEQTAAPNC